MYLVNKTWLFSFILCLHAQIRICMRQSSRLPRTGRKRKFLIVTHFRLCYNFQVNVIGLWRTAKKAMKYTYRTVGTCSSQIDFDINNGKVTNIVFTDGCNGNLKAISKLVNGYSADKIHELLHGNTCGFRPTSCADQLAIAVMQAKEKEEAQKASGTAGAGESDPKGKNPKEKRKKKKA